MLAVLATWFTGARLPIGLNLITAPVCSMNCRLSVETLGWLASRHCSVNLTTLLSWGSSLVICADSSRSIWAAPIWLRFCLWYLLTQSESHGPGISLSTIAPNSNTTFPSGLYLHLPRHMYLATTLHSHMKCPGKPQKLHCVGGPLVGG